MADEQDAVRSNAEAAITEGMREGGPISWRQVAAVDDNEVVADALHLGEFNGFAFHVLSIRFARGTLAGKFIPRMVYPVFLVGFGPRPLTYPQLISK